MTALLKEVTM